MRFRCIGGVYSQIGKQSQPSDHGISGRSAYEADVEHAHLTVISGRNVHTYHGKYLSDQSGYARSGVDLSNGDRLVERPDLDNEPNRDHALIRTHIVQRKGRCFRITLHS